jgi:GT2 family glycosyltransferase
VVAVSFAVGTLDDRLFLYGEDREWCWRMARAGWAIGVCPEAEFRHAGGTSAGATWTESERARREVLGHLAVTRQLHGTIWSRAFALLTASMLLLESGHPRREQSTRAEARTRGLLYLRAAGRSKPTGKRP